MKEGKQSIRELFSRSGIGLSAFQLDRFWLLYQKLVEKNPEADLTRLVTFPDIVVKHFIDSVMPGRLVRLPSPLLDIGTGAGFPALPLLIMDPALSMVLAEPRKKRVAFILEMIDLLGLANAEVYPHKVMPDFPLPVPGVITRALESAEETLGPLRPLSGPGRPGHPHEGPGGGRRDRPGAGGRVLSARARYPLHRSPDAVRAQAPGFCPHGRGMVLRADGGPAIPGRGPGRRYRERGKRPLQGVYVAPFGPRPQEGGHGRRLRRQDNR